MNQKSTHAHAHAHTHTNTYTKCQTYVHLGPSIFPESIIRKFDHFPRYPFSEFAFRRTPAPAPRWKMCPDKQIAGQRNLFELHPTFSFISIFLRVRRHIRPNCVDDRGLWQRVPHATNYPEPNGKQNHGRVGTSMPDNRFDLPASVRAYNLRVVTATCRRRWRCRRIANIIRILAVIDECRVTKKRTYSIYNFGEHISPLSAIRISFRGCEPREAEIWESIFWHIDIHGICINCGQCSAISDSCYLQWGRAYSTNARTQSQYKLGSAAGQSIVVPTQKQSTNH